MAAKTAGHKILAAIAAQDRLRTLVPSGTFAGDSDILDLTSNDYLDLRNDFEHQSMLYERIRGLPFGSGGSRLLGGEHPVFRELEHAVAAFVDAEDALFFPSGFAANEAVATTLGQLPDVSFFSDTLNHASIIDGIRAARLDRSRRAIFKHNDLADLEETFTASSGLKFIFTESLFSMDGDCPDLAGMQVLADKYQAILVIDEAHSFFCSGDNGRGLTQQKGVRHRESIRVLTCGKAFGLQGALVCCPSWFRDLMINTARPFIYTTAPSPVIGAAALATVRCSDQLGHKRERLSRLSFTLRSTLHELGYSTAQAEHHILPIICGENGKALALSAFLAEHKISSRAIRPPTVPAGAARVRLSLHAGLTDSGVSRIVDAFTEFKNR